MKPSTTSLLFTASLLTGSALTSCVVPADAYGTTTTYTAYHAGYQINSIGV